MKKENGITLISLIIYIVVLLLAVSMLSTISSYFYSNVSEINDESKYIGEYNKFNMFFLEDIKSVGIKFNNITNMNNLKIELYNENTKKTIKYVYEENIIYRDNVVICKNVTDFKATCTKENIITIYIKFGENNESQFEKTVDYVINN